ncbi:MAG: hypothetical protein UX71_C0010G0011 [Parcubacteria group bacterium GW2011_GWA1_47_10]|nr:MAG: hypothetical protein UX71_C0010G0011 [Parcubacteria group bacterium GW2011_GWA1_47_10]
MKKTYITIAVIIVLAATAATAYFVGVPKGVLPGGEPVACTMEAKICPDGSAVGRQGPNCEFAACPNIPVKTDTNNETKSEGAIGVGETKNVNGVRITLNKIVEDSRCPSDVQCIWAGRLVANVTLKSDTDEQTLDLASDAAPKTFDTFLVSIAGISPEKLVSEPSTSYKITFKVENNQ